MSNVLQNILTDTKAVLLPPDVLLELKVQYPQSHTLIHAVVETVHTLFNHSHYVEMEANRMSQLYQFTDAYQYAPRGTSGNTTTAVPAPATPLSSENADKNPQPADQPAGEDVPTTPAATTATATTPCVVASPAMPVCAAYIDQHIRDHQQHSTTTDDVASSSTAYLDHSLLGSFSTGLPTHMAQLLQRGQSRLAKLQDPATTAALGEAVPLATANLATFHQHSETILDVGQQKNVHRESQREQRVTHVRDERARIQAYFDDDMAALTIRHEQNMARLMEAFHTPIRLPQLDVTLKPQGPFEQQSAMASPSSETTQGAAAASLGLEQNIE